MNPDQSQNSLSRLFRNLSVGTIRGRLHEVLQITNDSYIPENPLELQNKFW